MHDSGLQMTGEIEIKGLEAGQRERWDDFVLAHPEATFFHLAGWSEVIERAFGHRMHFLYAEAAGRIVGVCPLGRVRSRLFGDALISTPFCVYGGVLAESEAARVALTEGSVDLARRLGVDYLEMRNRVPRETSWRTKDLYVTFRKQIDPDAEKNLLAIPRKQRAMVRKGIAAGLSGEVDREISRFYEGFAESVRNLGTPVLPRRYFRILKEVFGDDCEILTVTRSGRLVASVMSFYFRDEVLPYYAGGTEAARACKGNDFMYWDLMRRAVGRGCRFFDYGRSKKGAGSYDFKKNWGFSPEPLYYEYLPIRAREIPDVNPMNPKYRLLISSWKRLPLPVSKFLGPMISKYLA